MKLLSLGVTQQQKQNCLVFEVTASLALQNFTVKVATLFGTKILTPSSVSVAACLPASHSNRFKMVNLKALESE